MAEKTPEELEQELENERQAAEAAVKAAGEAAAQQAVEQGLSQQEVNAAVERARKEEKDKLYPQLEALKDSIKEIQEVLRAEREEKEQIKRDAEAEKEKQRLATLSDSEKQLEAIHKIEEQLKEEREERRRLQEQMESDKRQSALDAYRERAIQAAGDEIIPELVTGNTEAEIDRTIEIAKARYAELAEKLKLATGQAVRSGMPRSTSPNTEALEEQELEELQKNINPEKYRTDPAYREKVKAEAAQLYARVTGQV